MIGKTKIKIPSNNKTITYTYGVNNDNEFTITNINSKYQLKITKNIFAQLIKINKLYNKDELSNELKSLFNNVKVKNDNS
jgi:hypothetical protein